MTLSFGDEEKGWVQVAQTPDRAVAPGIGLGYKRQNGASHQQQIIAQGNWDNRLNIEDILGAIVGGNPKGCVVLKGDADQVGDRVSRRLPEVGGGGIWCLGQRRSRGGGGY